MKANIFKIPATELETLRSKLEASGMDIIKEVDQDGWTGQFLYSTNPMPGKVGWAETLQNYFDEVGIPTSKNPYAAFLFVKGDSCYVLSFGKAHFFIRPFCDYDFGIELAKRIANEDDTRQTPSRRFQGKKKKDIKSYANDTRLDIQSGESVDFIQAAVIPDRRDAFGKSGKFGTSALLTPDILPSGIGTFLTKLDLEMDEPGRFPLPRTTLITEPDEVTRFDELLVDELSSQIGTSQFVHNSFDLYGVDFVFSNDGTFVLSCPGAPRVEFNELSIKDLKLYSKDNAIERERILKIKVRVQPEGSAAYTKTLKEAVDFIADNTNVLLTNGRWMRFNQDYLDYLDDYLKGIQVEPTEPEFEDIIVTETVFNASAEVQAAGYVTADKDFSIFKTRSPTPVEAWDFKKDHRVYAVKFATPQKLGYVCDQAAGVLELLRNRAEVSEIPEFESYCLWLGYRAKNLVGHIADSGSIILKQKIESWARKARDLGIEPVIKISRKLKPGVEVDAASSGQ